MRISEMFPAVQGEGLTVGLPVYFVRLSGCNTECPWCDTKYAKNGTHMDNKDIMKNILRSGLEDVVITGGEPLLQIKEIDDLISYLPKHTFHLETNGSIYSDYARQFQFIACSPKKQQITKDLNSYKKYRYLPQTFFKFVFEDKNDQWWKGFMKDVGIENDRVWIMPEGQTREEQIKKMPEVIEYCLKNKYHFSPRLHILGYDMKRGV